MNKSKSLGLLLGHGEVDLCTDFSTGHFKCSLAHKVGEWSFWQREDEFPSGFALWRRLCPRRLLICDFSHSSTTTSRKNRARMFYNSLLLRSTPKAKGEGLILSQGTLRLELTFPGFLPELRSWTAHPVFPPPRPQLLTQSSLGGKFPSQAENPREAITHLAAGQERNKSFPHSQFWSLTLWVGVGVLTKQSCEARTLQVFGEFREQLVPIFYPSFLLPAPQAPSNPQPLGRRSGHWRSPNAPNVPPKASADRSKPV